MTLVALFRVVELLLQAASPFLIKCAGVKLLQVPANASSIAQSGICLAADLDPFCLMPHHCPCPCRIAASPCIFSLTFIWTSKNLETHRSKHTDSPLLRSPSRYSGGMHFLTQDWFSLFAERETEKSQRICVEIERRQWDGDVYLVIISPIISTSVSAAAIFSADEGCGRPKGRKDIVVICQIFRRNLTGGGIKVWARVSLL